MRPAFNKLTLELLLGGCIVLSAPAAAQQYNSDSYLSKPHGMMTAIMTAGERNAMLMNTFSLFPRWEFTGAVYTFYEDGNAKTAEGYSSSFYGKYMFFENEAKTGGFAVKAGTGLDPGYVNNNVPLKDAFRSYWTNAPFTLPLFGNKLSWDVMPGASFTRNYGASEELAYAFTYATRLAWYPRSPAWSLVGEVYGNEGDTGSSSQYRIGLRLESNANAVWAFTYDGDLNGGSSGGFEAGVMLFTPPFACWGGCK